MAEPRADYIAASELATALRRTADARPVVIDVRDEDFVGGHIRGAVNVPEWQFRDDDFVDQLVEKYRHAPQIVFHCMFSQVRGPRCANRFLQRVQSLLEESERPRVQVLVGGYTRFEETYRGEADLFEL
ncbi:hypothetical protein PINS_up003537 [Pythium insidiosum]|nr:hypothetical protein PINS_up003537 [Pythium insidiosum]